MDSASATADNCAVRQAIFTDPEVAAVGLTEAATKARGINAQVVDYDMGRVAGASPIRRLQRESRMVVDQERGVLIGMTLVGSAVGEFIHAELIAIVGPFRSQESGTPSLHTRPSARSGFGCRKHSADEHAPDSRLGDQTSCIEGNGQAALVGHGGEHQHRGCEDPFYGLGYTDTMAVRLGPAPAASIPESPGRAAQ